MRSQEHQKIREIATKKKHQLPVKRRATRLRKGDDKGLTDDAPLLPESIQPRQSEMSLTRWVK
jgi:hypothetical protein